MLTYEITYRLVGPKIFKTEITGRNFAECAHAFASKMQGGYVVLMMRFVGASKI